MDKQPKLTREQTRAQERINLEVQQTFDQLANKFLMTFTLSDDPEGEDILATRNKMSAQWRTYCKLKQLIPKAYTLLDKHAANVLNSYKLSKNGNENGSEVIEAPSVGSEPTTEGN